MERKGSQKKNANHEKHRKNVKWVDPHAHVGYSTLIFFVTR